MEANRQTAVTHTTIGKSEPDFILELANQFYQTKKVEGVSSYTLTFYKQQLGHFLKYCEAQVLTRLDEITPNVVRQFLLWHEQTGHNPGGLHAAYRVLRTFLLWYENEVEPEGWNNPIHKVKAPKIPTLPLEPVELKDVSSLLGTCKAASFLDIRDKAVFMFLLDTGARAREVLHVDIQDVDLTSGATLIRRGKGAKPRTVFLGKASRRALRAYLKHRNDNYSALWVTEDGERLEYGGLRGILERRAKQAGIKAPSLHSFRRAFAINMLRAGVDVFSLQKLMGHADLQVLRRYLAQTTDDIAQAHSIGSPVDNNKL
jgi:site-specific recombinase XerD